MNIFQQQTDEPQWQPAFTRGQKVNYRPKGNPDGVAYSMNQEAMYEPVQSTYVWALWTHEVFCYIIQHPDGHPKNAFMAAEGQPDGFEALSDAVLQDGLFYICADEDELEDANNPTSNVPVVHNDDDDPEGDDNSEVEYSDNENTLPQAKGQTIKMPGLLLLIGARQTGKTTYIKQLLKQQPNFFVIDSFNEYSEFDPARRMVPVEENENLPIQFNDGIIDANKNPHDVIYKLLQVVQLFVIEGQGRVNHKFIRSMHDILKRQRRFNASIVMVFSNYNEAKSFLAFATNVLVFEKNKKPEIIAGGYELPE